MSRLINTPKGKVTIIEVEPDMICGECGRITETRPYGPGGSEICCDCAQKDKERTEHNMKIKLFGEPGDLK